MGAENSKPGEKSYFNPYAGAVLPPRSPSPDLIPTFDNERAETVRGSQNGSVFAHISPAKQKLLDKQKVRFSLTLVCACVKMSCGSGLHALFLSVLQVWDSSPPMPPMQENKVWMLKNQVRVATATEVRHAGGRVMSAGPQRKQQTKLPSPQSLESQMGALLSTEEVAEQTVEQKMEEKKTEFIGKLNTFIKRTGVK